MPEATPPVRQSRWIALLVGFVLVEVNLQLIVVVFRLWTPRTYFGGTAESEVTILCLGESQTFGFSADTSMSYPRQLERLLQERWPERHMQVVNAGVPAFNSSQILHRLPDHLREIRPDLILLLVGINDWTFFKEVDFATLEDVEINGIARARIVLDQWLSHVQLYRLAKLLLLRQREWGGVTEIRPARHAAPVSLHEPIAVELGELIRRDAGVAQGIVQLAGEDPETLTRQDLRAQALSVVQGALEHTPDGAGRLLQLGHFLRQNGYESLAIKAYHLVIDRNPVDQDARLALANIYEARWDIDRAQALYEELLHQDPENPNYHLGLARVHLTRGDLEQAHVSAHTALVLAPESAEPYRVLGEVCWLQRAFDQAKIMFQKAIKVSPSDARSWFWLGLVYRELGQAELARQAFEEEYRLVHNLNALVGIGQSYTDPVESQQAMRALLEETQATAVEADSIDDWKLHGKLLEYDARHLPMQLLEANLEQMIEQLATAGVRVGLLTYPSLARESVVNQTIRTVAARHPEVLLIDAAEALAGRFADPTEALVSADGWHPNANGYGLLARHVLEALISAGALEDS